MAGFKIRNYLPRFLGNPLWGNRERWGLNVNPADAHWEKYQEALGAFYTATQRRGVGATVNDAGYRVISDIGFAGKVVLEVGAGDVRHIRYWAAQPKKYILADISEEMMSRARSRLDQNNVAYEALMLRRGEPLPVADHSVDVVISFYSLEHLYPFAPYLEDMLRVLKPGGVLIGAIPAEGGLAWGLGRFFTSRRWFKSHTSIDPDKIICWEHPNFADEIIRALDSRMARQKVKYWPLPWLPALDLNLIVQFQYRKK